MGILDRYPDWKEIDKGGETRHYQPEQPPYNGYVLPSLRNLKTNEYFYQKTIFKLFLIVMFFLFIVYYLLPNPF